MREGKQIITSGGICLTTRDLGTQRILNSTLGNRNGVRTLYPMTFRPTTRGTGVPTSRDVSQLDWCGEG